MRVRFALMLSLAAVLMTGPVWAETETAAPDAAPVLPAITVSAVEMRPMVDRVIVSGLIGPVEEVQVQPLIEGQPIETLNADVGDRVTAGQVLARLSMTALELQKSQLTASLASARATIAQAEAQMLEANASADEAQRVATRTAALKKQGTASGAANDQAQAAAISATARVTVAVQSLEAARAQLALVEAQMENVELQLTRTDVVAPVTGEIVERNAQLGSIATAAGQPMFVMIRDSALELRADVAEADLMRLAKGQKALLRVIGSPDGLAGTIRLVEPTIDTATRLGRARISVDVPDSVRSGMFAEAQVLAAERDALAVPVSAVGSGPLGETVMKVGADGVASRIVVQTGIRDGGFVEIREGVAKGDLVVTKAGAFVRDGDHINPVTDSGAAAGSTN